MHVLGWGENSAACWMPFLFMHLLFQAHKKHANLHVAWVGFLWKKELKRPDNCLQSLVMSVHVPCCPHFIVLANSSVLHHILFQIQLLATLSAHILVC